MRTLQRMGSLVLVLAGFTAGHVARADDTGDSHRQQCKEAFKACAESISCSGSEGMNCLHFPARTTAALRAGRIFDTPPLIGNCLAPCGS